MPFPSKWLVILLAASLFPATSNGSLASRRAKGIENTKLQLEEYYKCVTYREKRLLHLDSFPAEAVVALKHGRINLPCFHCVDPRKILAVKQRKVVWAHQKLESPGKLEPVPISNEKESSSKISNFVAGYFKLGQGDDYILGTLKNLIIQPQDLEIRGKITQDPEKHSGFYSCWDNDTSKLLSLYYVDILPELPARLVWKGIDGMESEGPVDLPEYGLMVVSDWAFWTECNRCGLGIGEEKLDGPCTVKTKNYDSFRKSKPTGLKKSTWTQMVGLLKIFPFGLPCRSSLLPKRIRSHPLISTRPDETKLRACKRECREESKEPRLKTRTGTSGDQEIVEVIPPGYYTFDDPKPFLSPPVERINSGSLRPNQTILFDCPQELPGGKFWRYLNKSSEESIRLSTMQARRSFSGRLFIDAQDRLLLRNVKETDEGIFSCLLWDHTLLLTGRLQVSRASILKVVQAYVVAIISGVMMVSVFGLLGYQTWRLKWGAREMREERKREKELGKIEQKVSQEQYILKILNSRDCRIYRWENQFDKNK